MTDLNGEFLPPRPWSLAPLKRKFYGTAIVDANGKTVCEMWLSEGPPSPREDLDPEDICDSHYESMADYQTATAICDAINTALSARSDTDG